MSATVAPARSVPFSILVGLTSLVVVLQAVWAGIFLQHDGKRDDATGALAAHAGGAYLACVLAVAALVVAVVQLRARRDLVIGSAVLLVARLLETMLGTLIRNSDQDSLTVVHVPLAMVIMGVVVWLPLRARAGR